MIKIIQLLNQIIVKKPALPNNQSYLSVFKNQRRSYLRKTLKRMLSNKKIHTMRALQRIILEERKIIIKPIKLNLSKIRKRKLNERRGKTILTNKVRL